MTTLSSVNRFRAVVGTRLVEDPSLLEGALAKGIDAVKSAGEPKGIERATIANEYGTLKLLGGQSERIRSYAGARPIASRRRPVRRSRSTETSFPTGATSPRASR